MNTALGWGLAALVGVTALSIDMSIIIPAHDARAARAETGAAWALARAALTHAGRSCQNTVAQSGGLTARPVAQGGRCVVHVTIPADPGVPAVVRGVRLAGWRRVGRSCAKRKVGMAQGPRTSPQRVLIGRAACCCKAISLGCEKGASAPFSYAAPPFPFASPPPMRESSPRSRD